MSTPNFYNKNAGKVYACKIEEEFDYEDLIMNLRAEIEGVDVDKWENGLRSYEGRIIKEIEVSKGKWGAIISVIIRNAYYSGVNLDWEVTGEDLNSGEEYDFENLPEYFKEIIFRKLDKIEKVFKNNSTPLNCLGIMSNGEAIYQKA